MSVLQDAVSCSNVILNYVKMTEHDNFTDDNQPEFCPLFRAMAEPFNRLYTCLDI